MVHGKNRIPYWIDRRFTGLAGPDYDATISFGLPFELGDCPYGKSRLYIIPLIILGAFLPWLTHDSPFETGVCGTVVDGGITLVLGTLALLLVVWAHVRPNLWTTIAALLVAAIVAVMMVRQILDMLTTSPSFTIGVGIYATLLGSIVILLGGASLVDGRPEDRAAASTIKR